MPSRAAREGLSLSEAAGLLDVSQSTLRRYVKTGELKASQVPGKFGTEYRILPTVLKVFALSRFSIELTDEELEEVKSPGGPSNPVGLNTPEPTDTVALYERLLILKDEAAEYRAQAERFRALSEVSDSTRRESEAHYQAQIAELQAEKTTLEARVTELSTRRRWWRRG